MKKLITIAVVIATAMFMGGLARSQSTVNQGAPGHQGPWPVYCVPIPNGFVAVANQTSSLTPSAVSATSCADTFMSVTGAAVGQACALAMPIGFSASLNASCIPQAGYVNVHICNSTGAPITPTAGFYTVVLF